MSSFPLFTVGHSNHTLADFVALLHAAGITAIADVRSAPFSRRQPHFNRDDLRAGLNAVGIAYVFLGDHVGGRPLEPACYDANGCVDYAAVRVLPRFQVGLDRLDAGRQRCSIALMCGEADPLFCHRCLLIAPALVQRGICLQHLRRDGTIELQEQLDRRVLLAAGLLERLAGDLFTPPPDEAGRQRLLTEACQFLGRKHGYRFTEGDAE